MICSMVRGGHSLFPSVATRPLEPRSAELEIRPRERIEAEHPTQRFWSTRRRRHHLLAAYRLIAFSNLRINSLGTVSVRSSSCKVSQ